MKLCGWLLMICLATPVLAAEKSPLTAPAGPIEVTSRQMEAEQQSGRVLFSGEVVAKRGAMTVYAERLSLFFIEIEGGREIERLEAEGGVRVIEGGRVATAKRLEYFQAEEKMILSGDAKIHQGENLVAGDEIQLFMRENRTLVRSGKDGRVRAVFLPQQGTE